MTDKLKYVFEASSDIAWPVRQAAATALGQVGSGQPEVVEALLSMLADSDFDVRQAAVTALGQVGSGQPGVVEALLPMLADSASNIRRAAASSLTNVITDSYVTGSLVEKMLLKYESLASKQFSVDSLFDDFLFTLQQLIGEA